MASLKGIKVDIPDNPYMNEEGELVQPRQQPPPRQLPPRPPPPPKRPLGATMTYAEKMRLAKEGGRPDSVAAEPAAASAAPKTPPPAAPTLSYAERTKQAREAAGAEVASTSQRAPPAARDPVEIVEAAPAPAPTRLLEPEAAGSAILGEDAAHAKVALRVLMRCL